MVAYVKGAGVKWQRARKPEQKAVRRKEILKAARTLFTRQPYEKISLNAIAREANLSKPNLYRYFATREEIFLALFEPEVTAYTRSLMERLKRIRSRTPARAIGRAWAGVALKHRNFLDLLPILSPSMEKNSSVRQLVAFKKHGFELFDRLLEANRRLIPELGDKAWRTVMQCALSLMAGLWPLANPGENVLEALRHPDVNQPPWEFEPLASSGITALIRGSIAERAKTKS